MEALCLERLDGLLADVLEEEEAQVVVVDGVKHLGGADGRGRERVSAVHAVVEGGRGGGGHVDLFGGLAYRNRDGGHGAWTGFCMEGGSDCRDGGRNAGHSKITCCSGVIASRERGAIYAPSSAPLD